jgi:hypothetical protein
MSLHFRHLLSLGLTGVVVLAGCGSETRESASSAPSQTPGSHSRNAPSASFQIGGPFHHVDFVPTPKRVMQACARTAAVIGYPTLCPRAIPAGSSLSSTQPPECRYAPTPRTLVGAGCSRFGRFNLRRWEFADLLWDPAGPGHVIIQAAPVRLAPAAFLVLDKAARRQFHPRAEGWLRIRNGLRARWYAVPQNAESSNAGHSALVWYRGGHTYELSSHGTTRLARRVAITMVRHSRFVQPQYSPAIPGGT